MKRSAAIKDIATTKEGSAIDIFVDKFVDIKFEGQHILQHETVIEDVVRDVITKYLSVGSV